MRTVQEWTDYLLGEIPGDRMQAYRQIVEDVLTLMSAEVYQAGQDAADQRHVAVLALNNIDPAALGLGTVELTGTMSVADDPGEPEVVVDGPGRPRGGSGGASHSIPDVVPPEPQPLPEPRLTGRRSRRP